MPDRAALPKHFATALQRLDTRCPLLLAVSGGGDSIAMLALAADWAWGRPGRRLFAATVDHGLRPEAAEEAAQVAALAEKFAIPHRTLFWAGTPGANLQARAREARYALLGAHACALGADLVTAHTEDDQAETFLLRLGRGSGLEGLAGMAGETRLECGVRLLRPLLAISRRALRAYLRHRGLSWAEDPSNAETRFARVRIRKLLSELGEEGLTSSRLARTAAHLARAQDAVDAGVEALNRRALELDPSGFARISLAPLLKAPEEFALRFLARVLTGVGGAVYGPRFERLERLWAGLQARGVFPGATLQRCRIARADEAGTVLLVTREMRALPTLPLSPGGDGLWDRRHRVQLGSGAPAGLQVAALGAAGVREAQDLLPAAPPAPRAALASLPALWQEGRLVAAPHLGAFAQGWARNGFRAQFVGLARGANPSED